MERLKSRYISLKPIKGYSTGVVKTKRVWCDLLGVVDEDDFKWLVNSSVLRSNKLNKIVS